MHRRSICTCDPNQPEKLAGRKGYMVEKRKTTNKTVFSSVYTYGTYGLSSNRALVLLRPTRQRREPPALADDATPSFGHRRGAEGLCGYARECFSVAV